MALSMIWLMLKYRKLLIYCVKTTRLVRWFSEQKCEYAKLITVIVLIVEYIVRGSYWNHNGGCLKHVEIKKINFIF